MNFNNKSFFECLIDDFLLGLEVLGKQINYILCTPGLNILFWLIMIELLIALVLTDVSSTHTIDQVW